jgi:hypothetical protein
VGLKRDVVQIRSLHPAPPLKARDVPRYVTLEAARLFRQNGHPLVTDGTLVSVSKGDPALWAAAVSEPLLDAILEGCREAGLTLEALAPSAETLPAALDMEPLTAEVSVPDGRTTERLSLGAAGAVWRSRWSRSDAPSEVDWVSALTAVNGERAVVAPAYAAGVRLPVLALLPAGHRAAARRRGRRRMGVLAAVGVGLWLLSGALYAGRLSYAYARATALLAAFHPAADSALSARRELDEARTTLETIARTRADRSRSLRLLAGLTAALPDSVSIIALQVSPTGQVRVTGYAPRAADVLARVGRVGGLSGASFEGAVTREVMAGQAERDRFTVVATERAP